jgi:hypothetical protein
MVPSAPSNCAPGPSRIQARQAAVGAQPEIARIVGQDGRNRVIGNAVLAQIAAEADAAILPFHLVQARRGADPDGAACIFVQVVHLVVTEAAGLLASRRKWRNLPVLRSSRSRPLKVPIHSWPAVFQDRPHHVVGQAAGSEGSWRKVRTPCVADRAGAGRRAKRSTARRYGRRRCCGWCRWPGRRAKDSDADRAGGHVQVIDAGRPPIQILPFFSRHSVVTWSSLMLLARADCGATPCRRR